MHQLTRFSRTSLGLIAAAAAITAHAADATPNANKLSWLRETKSLLANGNVHYVVVQKRDGVWGINSVDDRLSIENAEEEVVLARRIANGGWEFIPHFDVTDNGKQSDYQCVGKRPDGVPESTALDRARQTNLCDSQLTTSTIPKGELAGRAVGTVLATIFTGGLGAVALALDKRTNFYPQREELQKVVLDTRMDELLARIEETRDAYRKGVSQAQGRWNQVARQVKTRYVVKDASQGFAKAAEFSDAQQLVRYSAVFPQPYAVTSQYPTTLDGVAEFAARQQARLSQLGSLSVAVQPSCSTGSRSVGRFNVAVTECPKALTLEDESRPVDVPLEVAGVKADVMPSVQVDDKAVKVQLTANGLLIENLSGDFIDIVDVAISVNGKVHTLSGGSAALITVAPQTSYPRANEPGRFTVKELMDADMRAALSYANLTYPQAQASKIVTTISVRYAVDGRQKTLRGASTATVLELLRS